jgi:FkbM family methyltransferase
VSLSQTIRFIIDHPLNKESKGAAIGRFVTWQVTSRLHRGPTVISFVNGSKLFVQRGRPAATGNLYTGLHEFSEMGFVLHMLREGDLFADVGANIGAYSILAASLPGTRSIAFEPAADTYELLLANIRLNEYESRVTPHRSAIGNETGEISMTSGLDTINHVAGSTEAAVAREKVQIRTLDDIFGIDCPAVVKIDVEGYETHVIEGAERLLENETLVGLVIEMNGSGARYGLDESRLDQSVRDHGFVPLSYDPMHRRLIPIPSANPPGNRIYVRSRESAEERLHGAPPFVVADGRSI